MPCGVVPTDSVHAKGGICSTNEILKDSQQVTWCVGELILLPDHGQVKTQASSRKPHQAAAPNEARPHTKGLLICAPGGKRYTAPHEQSALGVFDQLEVGRAIFNFRNAKSEPCIERLLKRAPDDRIR